VFFIAFSQIKLNSGHTNFINIFSIINNTTKKDDLNDNRSLNKGLRHQN